MISFQLAGGSRSAQQRLSVVKGLFLPVGVGVVVNGIVNSESLWHFLSAMTVEQARLVEWLVLVVPVSVFGSQDVRVQVFLRLPGRFIEQLGVVLETRCFCSESVTLLHFFVKVDVLAHSLLVEVGL